VDPLAPSFRPPSARARPVFGPALVGGLVAGAVAFAGLLLWTQGSPKVTVALLAALVTTLLVPLSGNPRMACLILLLVFAPLGLRVTFLPVPHMGGAGAMFIDLIDPFMFFLLFMQLRDRVLGLRPYRVPPAAWFWAGMILLGVGTVIFGSLRTTAANETMRMFKLLVLMLVVVNEAVRYRQFGPIVVAVIASMTLQAMLALLQYGLGRQLGLGVLGEASTDDVLALSEATLLTRDLVYRPSGLLGHANLLAGYLALYMPVSVALLLSTVSARLKLLLGLSLMVGLPALVLTLSRAGWIEYSVAFLLVLWLGARHPVSRARFMPARTVIVAGSVAMVLLLTPPIAQRLSTSDPTAVTFRLEWLQTAAAMVIDNPVFGVGLNAYVYRQVPYGPDKTPQAMTERYGELWPAVHNSWMLAWTEQGTLGFALWVAVHVSVIRAGVRNLRIRDPMLHAMSAGLLAGVIAIMIDGLASFFVRTEAPARLFWIAVALILAIDQWRCRHEDPAPDAGRRATPPTHDAGRASRWMPARARRLR
jgi:O-antigen ligase